MLRIYTVLIGIFVAGACSASSISCQTNYDEYSVKVDQDTIALKKYSSDSDREVASQGLQTRNLPKTEGMAKVFFKNGLKFKLNIASLKSFSDVDDYLVVTSEEGHQMTYPLTCHI